MHKSVIAAAAALLLAAPTAAQAAGWVAGPSFATSTPSIGATIATAPSGASYAAWVTIDLTSGRATLAQQTAAADGTVGPLRALGEAGSGSPVVAAGPAGAAVLWTRQDAATDSVQLTLLAPDGTVRSTTQLDPASAGGGAVALGADGSALAVWQSDPGVGSDVVKAARVSPGGAVGPVADLGVGENPFAAALAPDGTGWVSWEVAGFMQVARVTPAGVIAAAPVALPVSRAIDGPTLTASAAGAVFTGLSDRVEGVRLPLSGGVVGSEFELAATTSLIPSVALADDGTATVAWTDASSSGLPGYNAFYARVAPGAATAAPQQIAPELGDLGTLVPTLSLASDGSLLAAWANARSLLFGSVSSRWIAADGTRGPISPAGLEVSPILIGDFGGGGLLRVTATTGNGGLLAVADPTVAGSGSITTRVYDGTPPQLTASIPAIGTTGQPLAFGATATDRAALSYWWDFGDGSGARTATAAHAYATPGTYAVTLTVTDAAGNVATAGRQLPIAPPPVPLPRRAAAALKLTSAVRSGAKVTVAGTIATSATGRVGLLYTQKNDRRTLSARTSAKIAGGRFKATIALSRALARTFRVKPTVTATYAGDTTTDAARSARTVTIRAARRAGRRGGKKKAKR